MRHNDAMIARRRRGTVWGGFLVLLGLVGAGLPESRAQMRYSGGFIPTRRPREITAPQPAAPKTTAPAAPKTPRDYFPDSDLAYPSYYARGEREPERPLPSPGVLPYGVPAADLPWNQAGFEDYNESPQIPRDSSLWGPKKYSLTIIPLPQAPLAERPETAVLIAHLPEHAVFWVEGTRTRSTGRTRYFQSPPLRPGRKYNYRVSTAWIEDGHWVSQTRMVPVQAGLIQTIFLRPAPALPAKAALKSLLK